MPSEQPADDASAPQCRRVLLERLVKLGLLTWTAGVATPALVYLWPARRGTAVDLAIAGQVKDFPVGSAKLIEAGGKPLLVIRMGEDEYRALSAICTHLGCLVEWRQDQGDVFCPCHGGRFAPDGQVLGGPPPSPLPRYPVTIVAGDVQVRLGGNGHGGDGHP